MFICVGVQHEVQLMAEVVAFVPNLMDRSRFPSSVTFIKSADQLAEYSPRLIVVDIDRCEDVAGFVVGGVETIGFGPHVESALASEAIDAGYVKVFTRSVFFKRCKSLLG